MEFYMIFFFTANAVRTTSDLRKQLALFFLVAVIVCGFCMMTMGKVERVGTPFEAQGSEPNTLGGYLMIVMCTAMGIFTQSSKLKYRGLFLLIVCIAFVPFLYTLSRASYIALLVSMTVLGGLARKWYLIAAVALTLVLSPFLMPPDVKDRVNYTFQRGTGEPITIGGKELGIQVDKSTHERVYVWQKVWYLLHVAPWFGGGVAWETVLDSQYARVIMETGLFGLAAFLFLQYRLIRTGREAYRWSPDWVGRGLAVGTTAATIGLITHSLGTISFLIVRIMEPYWLLMALTVTVRLNAIDYHARRIQEQRRAKIAAPAHAPARPAAAVSRTAPASRAPATWRGATL
jgi:O-antigen ligase